MVDNHSLLENLWISDTHTKFEQKLRRLGRYYWRSWRVYSYLFLLEKQCERNNPIHIIKIELRSIKSVWTDLVAHSGWICDSGTYRNKTRIGRCALVKFPLLMSWFHGINTEWIIFLTVDSATEEDRTKVKELLDEDLSTCFNGVHSTFTTFINVTIDTYVGTEMTEGVPFKVTFEEEVICKDIRVSSIQLLFSISKILNCPNWQNKFLITITKLHLTTKKVCDEHSEVYTSRPLQPNFL